MRVVCSVGLVAGLGLIGAVGCGGAQPEAETQADAVATVDLEAKDEPENVDPHVAREAAVKEAAEAQMLGLLNAGVGGDPDAPITSRGKDGSLGTDLSAAQGAMWGDEIGESFGQGGLALGGIGAGGGGEGIGLGTIGGQGPGTGQGFGRDPARSGATTNRSRRR